MTPAVSRISLASASAFPPVGGGDVESGNDEIGWPRAIVTGVVVLVVGLGITVVGTNEIITRVSSLSRDTVTYLASVYFLVCVVAIAWLLRWLQSRGVI